MSPTSTSPEKKKVKKLGNPPLGSSQDARADQMPHGQNSAAITAALTDAKSTETEQQTVTDSKTAVENATDNFEKLEETDSRTAPVTVCPKEGASKTETETAITEQKSTVTQKTADTSLPEQMTASPSAEEKWKTRKALLDQAEAEISSNAEAGSNTTAKISAAVPSPTRRKASKSQLAQGFNFVHTSPTADEWATGMVKESGPGFKGSKPQILENGKPITTSKKTTAGKNQGQTPQNVGLTSKIPKGKLKRTLHTAP